MSYKVIDHWEKIVSLEPMDWEQELDELIEEYRGLDELYNRTEIRDIWLRYSEDNFTTWLVPTPGDIEEAFNVKLTKIDEDLL
jgi:hypothetical protein